MVLFPIQSVASVMSSARYFIVDWASAAAQSMASLLWLSLLSLSLFSHSARCLNSFSLLLCYTHFKNDSIGAIFINLFV